MSLYDYKKSAELFDQDVPFYALIMTAMRKADTTNLEKLRHAFPETYREVQRRYNAPGGELPEDAQF